MILYMMQTISMHQEQAMHMTGDIFFLNLHLYDCTFFVLSSLWEVLYEQNLLTYLHSASEQYEKK